MLHECDLTSLSSVSDGRYTPLVKLFDCHRFRLEAVLFVASLLDPQYCSGLNKHTFMQAACESSQQYLSDSNGYTGL